MATQSANAVLQDQLIGHQVDLIKLEGTVRADVLKVLKELEGDLIKRLNAVDPTAPKLTAYQQQRLKALLKQTQGVIGSSFGTARKVTNKTLTQLAAMEAGLAAGNMNIAIGTNLGLPTLNRQQLQEIVADGFIQGAPSREWWAKQAADTADKFRTEMRLGTLAGENVGQLANRVRKIMDVKRYQAEALARTSVNSVANLTRLRTYAENAHLIKAIKWVSTLDSRTTDTCKGLDGLMWDPTTYAPIGHSVTFPGPTAHWNCRSTQVPVTYSFEELAKNPTKKGKRLAKKLDAAGAATRSALDGQVPKGVRYEDWLAAKELAEPGYALTSGALTPAKYALWKQGKLDFKGLIDQTGNPLTVEELTERLKDIIPATALPAAALAAQQQALASSASFHVKQAKAQADAITAQEALDARVAAAKEKAKLQQKSAAQEQLKAYAGKDTAPSAYHYGALKDLTKQKGGAWIDAQRKADPVGLLELIDTKAAKKKLSVDLAHYKQAVVKGKKPSAQAQAAFEALPDEAQKDVLDAIKLKQAEAQAALAAEQAAAAKQAELAAANAQAAEEIADTLANPKGKTKLAKALQDLEGDPVLKTLSPARKLAKAKELAGAAQAQAEKSAVLSGYKKKLVSGEKPTPKQAEVFNSLTPEEKAALTTQIEALNDAVEGYAYAVAQGAVPTKAQQKAYKFLSKKGQQKTDDWIADIAIEESIEAEVASSLQKSPEELVASYKAKALAGEIPNPLEIEAATALPQAKFNKLLKEIEAEKKAAAKAKVEPVKVAKEKPVTPVAESPEAAPPNADRMVQIGPQKGSNEGGLFQDPDTGEKFYLKFPASEDIARNEVLASQLYRAAGIDAAEVTLITREGKVGVASRFVEGLKTSKAALTNGKTAGVAEGFMTDAWLANWDVAGLKFDNLVLNGNKAFRVDVGGALRYRAMGGLKGAAFNKTVAEIDTLLNAGKNAQTAAVFNSYTKAQLEQGAIRVASVSDDTIRALVREYGPTSAAEQTKLAEILIARKNYITKKYASLTKEYQALHAQAVAEAQADVASAIKEIDNRITTALKGINVRAGQGAALEAKDIQRVKDARAELNGFLHQQGDKMVGESREEIAAYYEAWVSDLEAAVKAGEGTPAKWSGAWFKGYDGTPQIDGTQIKVEVAFIGDPAAKILPAAGIKILKDAGISHGSYARQGTGAFKNLEPHHVASIRAYTGKHYGSINRELRAPGTTARATREYERLLNQSLSYSTKYVGESTRGITLHGDEYTEFMAGIREAFEGAKSWSDKGFMSSSKGARAAFSGNIVLHFKGKTGVYVRPISLHPSENEVLFGTEARFLVTNIDTSTSYTHIYLTEVLE